jgi:hypothetical protein
LIISIGFFTGVIVFYTALGLLSIREFAVFEIEPLLFCIDKSELDAASLGYLTSKTVEAYWI